MPAAAAAPMICTALRPTAPDAVQPPQQRAPHKKSWHDGKVPPPPTPAVSQPGTPLKIGRTALPWPSGTGLCPTPAATTSQTARVAAAVAGLPVTPPPRRRSPPCRRRKKQREAPGPFRGARPGQIAPSLLNRSMSAQQRTPKQCTAPTANGRPQAPPPAGACSLVRLPTMQHVRSSPFPMACWLAAPARASRSADHGPGWPETRSVGH